MTKENLIHVKFEYEEARDAKKDILSTELNILNLAKIMKRYHFLRLNEFRNKMKLLRKISELKSSIGGLQQTLPKIKTQKILEKEKEPEKERRMEEKEDNNLESQLRKIQERLREIG